MTPVRLAFYSAAIFLSISFVVIITVMLVGRPVGGAENTVRNFSMLAAVVAGFAGTAIIMARLLRKNASRYQIRMVTQEGHPKEFTSGILVGFMIGAFWRSVIVNLVTQAGAMLLKRAYGDELDSVTDGLIDLVGAFASLVIAFWWVYRAPLGNHRITFGNQSVTVMPPAEAGIPANATAYSNVTEAVSSTSEAIVGTLGVIAALSYYAIGLVQLFATVTFLDSVWGWWLIPAIVVGAMLAYIPLVGSLMGVYAAVSVWGWSIYAAVALFFFPLIIWLVIAIIAGGAAATNSLFGRRSA